MAKKTASSQEPKKLYKSRKDKIIDGVCAGFADYFGIDVTILRVLWLASLFAGGLGFWAYIAAMVLVPKNPDHETLEDTERTKHHPGIIWGAGLILLGVLILSDRWDLFQPWNLNHRFLHWGGPFWSFGDIFPFLILAAGIAYLVYALQHKSSDKEDEVVTLEASKDAGDKKQFRRSVKDRWVGGVLNGLAHYLNIDVVLIRIAFIAVSLVTHPFFFALVYVGLWVAIPEEQL